jgi:DNA-binding LacI/PurR family transcriptional regulator
VSSNSKVLKQKNRKRASSVDVAKRAGVSQATVSRVFTKQDTVTDTTRIKVMNAAEELGYNPNAIARGLIQNATSIIGIVMLRFMNPFYAYMLKKFTLELLNRGFVSMLFAIDDEREIEEALPKALQYYVDGLIITSATLSSRLAQGCVHTGTPVVLVNRYTSLKEINTVRTDNVAGGRRIAEYFIERRFKKIAYLAGETGSSTNLDRREGFVQRLGEVALKVEAEVSGDYSYESGYELGKELLTSRNRPDAVFCANDLMAFGLMDVARSICGLNIPQELAVVGFDDIPMSSWPVYSLTTYHQPVDSLVEETIDVLLGAIKDQESEAVTKVLAGDLIVRGSA